jgi:hypothetical protein
MNVMLEKALSQRYLLPNIEVILSPKSQSVGNRSNDRSLKNYSPFSTRVCKNGSACKSYSSS